MVRLRRAAVRTMRTVPIQTLSLRERISVKACVGRCQSPSSLIVETRPRDDGPWYVRGVPKRERLAYPDDDTPIEDCDREKLVDKYLHTIPGTEAALRLASRCRELSR